MRFSSEHKWSVVNPVVVIEEQIQVPLTSHTHVHTREETITDELFHADTYRRQGSLEIVRLSQMKMISKVK